MQLSSPAIKANNLIDKRFSCQGNDFNPPLVIENVPEGAKSLALIMEDSDSLMGHWVHWVAFDLPVVHLIEENSASGKSGENDFGIPFYCGPCPGYEPHRYSFKLYALDTVLNLKQGINRKTLEHAMEGHRLDEAELIGTYKRDLPES